MVSPKRIGHAIFAALIIALAVPRTATAQDFPSRPVRFIVPYAAGGSGDVITRLLGQRLTAIWGQQVVVENKPGGGGLIGTELAVRSPPDGYTLYMASDGPTTVAPSLYKTVPYDWERDLAPLSLMAIGYQLLIVSPQLPVKTLADFVALARQKPGALNYASIGIGSTPHMGAEIFKAIAKVDILHVPYAGSTAQAITALLGGEVSMFMVGTTPVIGQIQAGKLRGLAVTSPQRMEGLADVPTFTEAGMPDVDVKLWFAVMAPSATPQPILDKLHADIAQATADPEYKGALKTRGFEAVSSTPTQLAEFMNKDARRLQELIKDIKVQAQ